MKVAFISDMHGNLEALTTVFQDIDNNSDINFICCTGDVVGYYPHPLECIDMVRKRCKHVIKGNHDEVVIDKNFDKRKSWFNPIAAAALTWTREKLLKTDVVTYFQYLESLPVSKELVVEDRKVLLAHGTPENKWDYFLYPFWLNEPPPEQKVTLGRWLKKWDLVVIGHTHQPFIYKYRKKVVLNPGSVGQPRDGDPKASYAIVEINTSKIQAKIIRIDYDIKETCKALLDVGLHKYLCERLISGN
ncbi:MAG: metallophosphoesterase family protein [Candidatus Thorarchaeota archaeon]